MTVNTWNDAAAKLQLLQTFNRLMAIAEGVEVTEHDRELIMADITIKLKEGWTADEIVSYVRNTEEINPTLDEDVALANMRRIKEAVLARLAGHTEAIRDTSGTVDTFLMRRFIDDARRITKQQ